MGRSFENVFDRQISIGDYRQGNRRQDQEREIVMQSTTGTALNVFLENVKTETEKRSYGSVVATIKIERGQIVGMELTVTDKQHFSLGKE